MNQITQLHKQAKLAMQQQSYELVHQCCLQILSLNPKFADAWFYLAMIAAEHGRVDKAIGLIEKALRLAGTNAEYLVHLSKCLALNGQHNAAAKSAQTAEQTDLASAFLLDTLGVTYTIIGRHDKAVKLFKKALNVQTNQPNLYLNLAKSLRFCGESETAKQALIKTIELAPNHAQAWWYLSSVSSDEVNLSTLLKLNQSASNIDQQLYYSHAIANMYEHLGQYDKAFAALSNTKAAKKEQINYHFERDQQMFDAIERLFSDGQWSNTRGHGNDEAIFVVGMPRSGTSIVERIISNHADVTSAGEMQHFGYCIGRAIQSPNFALTNPLAIRAAKHIDFAKLGENYINSTRALTGNNKRFVDKMPLNVLHVGFILAALPNAKVICLDRNPLDTVMSNYRQLFAANQGYYDYAYSIPDTVQYYQRFKQLCDFWQASFADKFLRVDYQKLVNDPTEQGKALMSFCQLDWQDDLADIAANRQAMPTASALQVKQPINNQSVGNWRRYSQQLASYEHLFNR